MPETVALLPGLGERSSAPDRRRPRGVGRATRRVDLHVRAAVIEEHLTVGQSSIRVKNVESREAFGTLGTGLKVRVWGLYIMNASGALNTHGLTSKSTFPFGRTEPGPSALSNWRPLIVGICGPLNHRPAV